MRLSKIKLCGFKSFVDPTTVELRGDLVGIVGPNGCGKSNIIDAVRWVMGESSAKTLRGDSMTDVIFNGAATRKPVGQATVELLFDNSDGTIAGEYAGYSEISIKRLVNREAQSTYFLNGVRCRRRDITGIFLGTGLGPRSYSIIEQGMISRFIEAKPDDLRIFIEEAAGISKYKERRRETENRIRHTRENVARVTDIRDELHKQLERLERQAQAAEKFKEFKAQERVLRAQLQAIRIREIDADSEVFTVRLRELETLQAEQHAKLQRANTDLENNREGHIEASDTFNEVQKRFYGVGHEITRLEQSISHEREKRDQLQRDFDQVVQDFDKNNDSLAEDNDLIVELQNEIAELTPLLEQAKAALSEARSGLSTAETQMQSWQREWDVFNNEAHSNTQKAEVSQTKIQHLENQVKVNRDKITRFEDELQKFDTAAIEATIAELEESLVQKQSEFSNAESELRDFKASIAEAREGNQSVLNELQTAKRNLQTLAAKQASLETLQKAAMGKSDNVVSNWLQEKSLDSQPRLVQSMQVEDKWSAAVETVLGSYLEAVCVNDVEDVVNQIDGLHDANVTILQKGPSSNAGHDFLGSKVTSEYDLSAMLRGVRCADTLGEALSMRSSLSEGDSIVTPDGIWLSKAWLRVTRKSSDKSGVIAREKELNQVATDIEDVNKQVADLEAARQAATEKLSTLESDREQMQKNVNAKSSELADVAAARKVKAARLTAMNDRISELSNEKSSCQQVIDQSQEKMVSAKSTWDLAMSAIKDSDSDRQALLQRKETYRDEVSRFKSMLEENRQASHEADLRVQTNQSQLGGLKQGIERLSDRLESLNTRRVQLSDQLDGDKNPIPGFETELESFLQKRLAVEEEMGAARSKLQNIEAQIRELETQRQSVERDIERDRNAVEEQRLSLQSLKVRKQTILEKLQEMEITLEDINKDMPEENDAKTWESELELMERRISRLGAINLAAIEEYDAQAERKKYLDVQLSDLEEALDTLETAIAKIDKETKDRFKQTYDTVNESFKELFPKIFGGGSAYLELTGDDLLSTGVTVMAQPPGKRNSTIHLLSGGEKALTAISLVFSIFKLNPSPFCILDEVDAPLDDANVARFCNLVKDMKSMVQFMFISHNKVAIEMSEQLVGVTMQEPGVSRLVAVDIDEAVAMAEV